MQFLKANTAVDVLIGPFVDKDDGNTTEDGLSASLTSAATKLSKNGQALAARDDVTDCAFDDDGYYKCELNTTDTNTEGNLVLIAHIAATALPVRHEFNVLSEAAYDSMFVEKDVGFMDVNIKTIGRADATETEATNLEAACAAYGVKRGLSGTALPDAVADAIGGLPISDAGGLDMDALQKVLRRNSAQDSDAGYIKLDAGANANDNWYNGSVVNLISGGSAGQSRLITDYNGTTKHATVTPSWNDTGPSAGEKYEIVAGATNTIQTESLDPTDQIKAACDTALSDINLDHLMGVAVGNTADMTTEIVDESVLSILMTSDGDTSDFTAATESLTAIGTRCVTIVAAVANIGTAGVGLTSVGLADGAITAAKLAVDCITEAKIADDALASEHFAPLDNTCFVFVDGDERVDVGEWLGTAATSGTGGPDVNVNAIGDSTTAAANLSASALGIVTGACEGTPTATVIQTDLAETIDDHYIGRVVVFTSGNASGEATDITDYTGSSGTITVTALTTEPVATDTFVIV